MKKALTLLLTLMFAFSLSACGSFNFSGNITTNSTSGTVQSDENSWTGTSTTDAVIPTDENQLVTTITSTNTSTHIHMYSEATCTNPKTCSCGDTEGEALGHDYIEGTCSRCGDSDPNYSPNEVELCSMSVTDSHFYNHINEAKLVKDTVGNIHTTGNLFALGSGGSYTGQKKPPFATYYLGGQYSTLTLNIAIDANSGSSEAYFMIYDENDNILYQTDYIGRQFAPQQLNLDVSGMEWITFKLVEESQMDNNVVMLLSNPIFHK